jgi:glycosyltransferase involved in cell wall biosynthesis
MDNNILITVIMPSLNSAKTIEKALSSVRMQAINQDSIEILVIDGGSTDNTRSISEKYQAIVIDNPQVVPEAAKRIGLQRACGKYAMWLDTDEQLTDTQQLQKRINLFRSDPRIKAVLLDGYITPKDYPPLAEYINCFGDAFSFFVYGIDSGNMTASLQHQPHVDFKDGRMFLFGEDDVIPIGDGGSTMFDLQFAKEIFSESFSTQDFAVTIFQSLVTHTGAVGIIAGDRIVHYASTTLKTFCNKLRFRAKTNIHNQPGYGFAARAKQNKAIDRRKYLFLIYCLLFPWPIWDAVCMCLKKKRLAMMMHVLFTYYILFQVVEQYLLKTLNIKPANSSYGK